MTFAEDKAESFTSGEAGKGVVLEALGGAEGEGEGQNGEQEGGPTVSTVKSEASTFPSLLLSAGTPTLSGTG